jgi:hypothetical protein
VTVLDFIGQSHRQLRFDFRYRAITGTTRTEAEKQVRLGFPFLPAGCSMFLSIESPFIGRSDRSTRRKRSSFD